MNHSEVRICSKCKKERSDDETEEARKFKTCTSCRSYIQQSTKKRQKQIQESFNSGLRLCIRCGKGRSDDESEETRKFKMCSSCRTKHTSYRKTRLRKIKERVNSGLRICTRRRKAKTDDEADETGESKLCSSCRHHVYQYTQKSQRKIKESSNSEVRLCTRCGKTRPDNEPEANRKFGYCSPCRRTYRQKAKEIQREITETSINGISLCTRCGKERPDHEPEESRKFMNCLVCRSADRQRKNGIGKKTSFWVTLPYPNDIQLLNSDTQSNIESAGRNKSSFWVTLTYPKRVQLLSADTQLSIESGVRDATSDSSPVQSPSRIAQNQNFTIQSPSTDNEQTYPLSSESGEISLDQEIADIQPQHAMLESNRIARAMRDPNNLLAYYCIEREVEVISCGEGEDSEISEETEMTNFSSSDFLETLKPNPELQSQYQKYLAIDDIMGFSERYISDTMDKYDIIKMIVALGYPKEKIRNYKHLTATDILEVLIDLINEDVLQEGNVSGEQTS
ncbi:uncharacterized protein J8A68_000860 [[Candida] subhashii]|uniref:Stc1 domain-containing protein n=1 Tax=[Candida] subhashii TaxID=561895 RepID=A0A8J5QH26_9ASCO|nr:uncharacterized protein J8A68_000860 [[Candida] subhashii]KAG7665654.1 hypothetical protein J8A68_000860 [[Candida] subhashii]